MGCVSVPKPSKKARKAFVPANIDRRSTELPVGAEVFEAQVECPKDGIAIVVAKTRRADLLGNMLARRQIEPYQFAAGERLQNAFETFGSSGVRSFDFSKPFVDSSQTNSMPLSSGHLRAANDIRRARSVAGDSGFALLFAVLCEHKTIEQIAKDRAEKGALAEKHIGWLFRDCLSRLAGAFGLIVRGASPHPQPRDKHSRLADKYSVGTETRARHEPSPGEVKPERNETRRDTQTRKSG